MIAGLWYLVASIVRKSREAAKERSVGRAVARMLGERRDLNPNMRKRGLVFDSRGRTRIPKIGGAK